MTNSTNGYSKHPAYLIAGIRTPMGSFGRSLAAVTVDKLAEHVLLSVLRRANVDPLQIDGIVLGHGYQSSYTPNTARFAAINAGLPATIPAMTVQRQCGSGMEAVNIASRQVQLGAGELYIAGGVESMSSVPYLLPGTMRFKGLLAKKFRFGPRPIFGMLADDGLAPLKLMKDTKSVYMAATAQRVADTYGVSRKDADEYALRSQTLANKAVKEGRFAIEIDPIQANGRKFLINDEHPRATSAEKLAALPPVLGTRQITAGNSSGINDGGCALLIGSAAKSQELGIKPLAKLIESAVVGVDPEQMGLGPVVAITKLLQITGLSLNDIDLFEINEAFAAQYIACEKLLKLNREQVNVNGGAIALGHPIGMSGARLLLTLAHELKIRNLKRGIASLCIGGGMGIATLIEQVEE
jgi:acetyl-CoA C-acetyltransferase